MNSTVNGETKLALAKEAISKFIMSIDSSVAIGTIVYGHKGSNAEADKLVSCQGVEIIAPLKTGNANVTTQSILSLQARGWTPIAGGLTQAGLLFRDKNTSEGENLIVLVTDGEETCGGSPADVARSLYNSDEKIQTNVIAFDLSLTEEASLKTIAEAGGGTFVSAKDGSSLEAALEASGNLLDAVGCGYDRSITLANDRMQGAENLSACLVRAEQESLDIQTAIATEAPHCMSELQPIFQKRQGDIREAIQGQFFEGMNSGVKEQSDINSDMSDSFNQYGVEFNPFR
jgi:hypothetical protein